MDLAYSLIELVVDTMNGLPLIALLVLNLVVVPPLVLWHELGHAAAALALTRGRVEVRVGADHDGPLWFSVGRLRVVLGLLPFAGGECSYEPDTVWRGRHEAWVAAAGPLASALAAVGLTVLALALGPAEELAVRVLVIGAGAAAVHTLMSVLPIRYALGSGAAGAESDGLAMWRILTGGTGRIPVMTHGVATPAERVVHPVVAIVLLAITAVTFFLDVRLGVALVALFGLAWWLQMSDVRAGR